MKKPAYILLFLLSTINLLVFGSENNSTNNVDLVNMDSIGVSVDETTIFKDSSNLNKKGENVLDCLTNLKVYKKNNKKPDYEEKDNKKRNYNCEEMVFVVAKVNNDIITNIDIINAIKFVFFSSGKKYDPNVAKLISNTLINSMIYDKLQQQYAKMYRIQVSQKEINDKVEEIAKNNGITVQELSNKFEELGISMDIFKENLKSRALLQFITEIIGGTIRVSDQEILEARAKASKEIKENRYYLSEILFRVDDKKSKDIVKKNAETILNLLKKGFKFQVMASVLSQGYYSGAAGDLGWVKESSIDKETLNSIKNLKPNEFTEVIETKTGYKIICVLDKANPGKLGLKNASYKVLSSKLKYKDILFTQKDLEKINESVEALSMAKSTKDYKEICKKYNINVEEFVMSNPNEYYEELINKSKETNKPSILQDIEDRNSIRILMLVSTDMQNASIPTDKELSRAISYKKLEEEFKRNFKKMKNAVFTNINYDKLKEVF